MSATVAAALKKIAIALLSDRKTAKKIGVLFLSILVGLLMPVVAIIGLFSGSIQFDADDIATIALSLDAEEVLKLTTVQDTLDDIEAAMEDAGEGDRYEEAQILYLLALYDYQDEDDFVDRLVTCFEENDDDEDLIDAVNDEFGCDINATDYIKVVTGLRESTISAFGYYDPSTKNAGDLVMWAWEAYNDHWGYVWGTYGQILTQESFESLCERFPDHVENYHDFIQNNWVGRRTADCAGLIKSYLWFNPDSHQIVYGSNGFSDMTADVMYNSSTVNGTIDTLPETPGLGVWHQGHVGIYIGDGWVIQASGTESGVIKTRLDGSSFTNWFEIPGIQYPTGGVEETVETTEETLGEASSTVEGGEQNGEINSDDQV